jgi:hypothetical protein
MIRKILQYLSIIMTKAIFHEQQPVIAAPDRVKILGKGKPSVSLGELVEIRVISGSGP